MSLRSVQATGGVPDPGDDPAAKSQCGHVLADAAVPGSQGPEVPGCDELHGHGLLRTGFQSEHRTALRRFTVAGAAGLILAYLTIWACAPYNREKLLSFWPFSVLGLFAALVANSTGVRATG
jgi:hypothetical protein